QEDRIGLGYAGDSPKCDAFEVVAYRVYNTVENVCCNNVLHNFNVQLPLFLLGPPSIIGGVDAVHGDRIVPESASERKSSFLAILHTDSFYSHCGLLGVEWGGFFRNDRHFIYVRM